MFKFVAAFQKSKDIVLLSILGSRCPPLLTCARECALKEGVTSQPDKRSNRLQKWAVSESEGEREGEGACPASLVHFMRLFAAAQR